MRRLNKVYLTLSVLAVLFVSVGMTFRQRVEFPDPNLEKAIRDAIGKPGELILKSDLEKLTEFHAQGKDIHNLTGLEYCINLTYLNLAQNQISDINLSNLPALQYLDLRHSQISNLSPLSNLTNLKILNLGANDISDIGPLSSLINLQDLNLVGNQISDIRPLVENEGLGYGDQVSVGQNPLSSTSKYSYWLDIAGNTKRTRHKRGIN